MPTSIAAPVTCCPRAKTPSSAPSIPGGCERIHEPGLHRAGVEGEAEAHPHRHGRERDHAGASTSASATYSSVVDREDGDREEERGAPAERVRDDARRHLEDDHPRRERCVGDEDLEEAESPASSRKSVLTPQIAAAESV